jgi:Mg-chelatase subunit ChlD
MISQKERWRRWQLTLGVDDEQNELSDRDRRLNAALSALYDNGMQKRRGGLGASSPRVAKWLGDIREFFPTPVVQIVQKDAFERLNLKALMLEPEFLSTLEADVHLVADLIALRAAIPGKTLETARQVVRKVVDDLMRRLEHNTRETLRGALNRSQRTRRPRHSDIDWPRTIGANLRHYQPQHRTVVPETLVGHTRHTKSRAQLDHVILCVDQSGSMATSVVYSSIFAAVMASIPGLSTKLICFDTSIVDLTDQLADPVDVLFGVQLGGGTDINSALAYCEKQIENPTKTHLVRITDLYEGGDAKSMLARAAAIKQCGVSLIVLLALSDSGHPAYEAKHAEAISGLGCPVFACTPDQFPSMMASALTGKDLRSWAAEEEIALIRSSDPRILSVNLDEAYP